MMSRLWPAAAPLLVVLVSIIFGTTRAYCWHLDQHQKINTENTSKDLQTK